MYLDGFLLKPLRYFAVFCVLILFRVDLHVPSVFLFVGPVVLFFSFPTVFPCLLFCLRRSQVVRKLRPRAETLPQFLRLAAPSSNAASPLLFAVDTRRRKNKVSDKKDSRNRGTTGHGKGERKHRKRCALPTTTSATCASIVSATVSAKSGFVWGSCLQCLYVLGIQTPPRPAVQNVQSQQRHHVVPSDFRPRRKASQLQTQCRRNPALPSPLTASSESRCPPLREPDFPSSTSTSPKSKYQSTRVVCILPGHC
jgi:hypothetical protein